MSATKPPARASAAKSPAPEFDRYDPRFAVAPFGLNNTGVICHFNSLLQALLGCSAFVRAVLTSRAYLARTGTGRALFDFVYEACARGRERAAAPGRALFGPRRDLGCHSALVLGALVADLRARLPRTRFGPSQESASEGLVLLLDMLTDPDDDSGDPNPVANVFYHRYIERVYCGACKKVVSTCRDAGVQFNLFHYDAKPPADPPAFAKKICSYVTPIDEYTCEKCGEKKPAYRQYHLELAPEVLVCAFNQYGAHRARYVPTRYPFPARDGTTLMYRQVGQIEHSGNLSGGHYVARGLRKEGKVYRFNDMCVCEGEFAPSEGTYLVFHHLT